MVYIIKENKKVLGGIMTVDNILTIIKDIIDVCLVWAGVYFILKSIKNNVKFTMLFKGIIIIVIIVMKMKVLIWVKII